MEILNFTLISTSCLLRPGSKCSRFKGTRPQFIETKIKYAHWIVDNSAFRSRTSTAHAYNNHDRLMIFVLDRKLKTFLSLSSGNKMTVSFAFLFYRCTCATLLQSIISPFALHSIDQLVWKMTKQKPIKTKRKTISFIFTNDVCCRCCCFRNWNSFKIELYSRAVFVR